jgi:hypothetical protein
LATPNYGYEKRQKELAKKRKKEDKLKAKSERKLGEHGEELDPDSSGEGSEDVATFADGQAGQPAPASEPPTA